jgi:hypothetical protein
MSKTPALVYILYALVVGALSIAPVLFVYYLAAQSALSHAAHLYADEPSCRQTAKLPDPRQPIAASALSGSPCRLTGAMIVDKTYTGGLSSGSYSLGLRDDAGVDRSVALGGPGDAVFFNRVRSGLRVIVQLNGDLAMSIGDSIDKIQTRDNPDDIARRNALSVTLFGILTGLELVAVIALLIARRRAAC